MDEQQETTAATEQQSQAEATPSEASAQAPATAAADAPAYVVATPVEHNRVRFEIGQAFPAALASAEEIATLLKEGALKFAHEVEQAAQVAGELAAKNAEIDALRAQVEALRAQAQRASAGTGRGR